MSRHHTCDVPGCGGDRTRWQRLCDRCFAKLPGDLRVAIKEAKHQRRHSDWNRARKEAAKFLGLGDPMQQAVDMTLRRLPPEKVFEMNQRLMGERSDT